ncbi:hypothetical protein [Wenjunlia tyrosinilytica]|jgi:hypothetical protein|uniref:Uncharacterized protein n=1 Tax=Wenjunlia tyrosinilytica TaxID=1544741 RepID=A0A917ZYG5_9ACTN|nr:hypothetical protein [Wenjunlia tyrosinilytica]GGO99866.1 hypothetical protein GCM10012280_67300 [Wenjunlia tyrosinilytica]
MSCSIDNRRALEFLQSSGLVNLDISLEHLVRATTTLDEVAGYVLAWEKYVLVVASECDAAANPGD